MLIIISSQTGDPWKIVSYTIFGVSMLLLFLCSTLLHSIQHKKTKDIFEILDHSAIYILIAGTYTPFVLGPLRGPLGWSLFGVVWGLAIAGVIFKVYFVKRFIVVSTVLYVIMGWLIIGAIKPLYTSLGTEGFLMLVAGGVLYTVGSVFYVLQNRPYFHAVWHVFVLAGSSFMYFCVLFYI